MEYLGSDPILWIPSNTFFKWLHRRVADLYHLILLVVKGKSESYGTTVLVLLHLIRCSMVTPIVKMHAVRDALTDVRFSSIPLRFGMFFLYDFDMNSRILKEVLEDPSEIRSLYRKTRKPAQSSDLKLISGQQAMGEYPWGPTPSWIRVKKLLEQVPGDFVKDWWMPIQTHPNILFNTIFMHFTRNLWTALGENVISEAHIPDPDTLEKAMASWTVKGILELLGEDGAKFMASCDGLSGTFPKALQKSLSFKERGRVLFPEPDTVISKQSIWQHFFNERAYIGLYRGYLRDWNQADITDLKLFLDEVFSNLQCLPPLIKAGERIWSAESGKVLFIVNPKFYKIQGVGSSTIPAHKATVVRPQVSTKVLGARLKKDLYGVPLEQTLKRVRSSRKNTKARNYRKPPTKKNQISDPLPHIPALNHLSSSSSSSSSNGSRKAAATASSEDMSSDWY